MNFLRLGTLLTGLVFLCSCGAASAQPAAGSHDSAPAGSFIANYIAENGKGYKARPCGFDLNRNGVLGEPADRLIGDGKTKDIDGDGVDEDLLYVDSRTGDDATGDGSPERPYKTIQKALDMADGPADGAEDIICIAGVFKEELMLTQSGVAGKYVRDGFEFPANPMMIVGWDRDGDGEYPPYDTDDVAVLDGGGELLIAINNRDHGTSFVEIAHLSIRDYGGGGWTNEARGAIRPRGKSPRPVQSHLYFHDIEMQRINKGAWMASSTIVVNFFPQGGNSVPFKHAAFINNRIDEFGSFCFRGSNRMQGPLRFRNNSLKYFGAPEKKAKLGFDSAVNAFKLWGQITGIEIVDNVIDGNPRGWGAKAHTAGAVISQCSQDVTVRGNVFLDIWVSVIVKGDSPAPTCRARPTTDVVIDRNIIYNSYEGWASLPNAINISASLPGSPITAIVEDVTITNNFISSTTGWNAGIFCMTGNFAGPQPGTITIAGNTIVGPFGLQGHSLAQHAISIYPQSPYRPESFVIKNNILANTGPGKRNIGVNYAPKEWIAEGNVYDPRSGFLWNNRIVSLKNWRKLTGQDANSVRYRSPTFANLSEGDLHLAADANFPAVGVDITDITGVDFDGQPRSKTDKTPGADISTLATEDN